MDFWFQKKLKGKLFNSFDFYNRLITKSQKRYAINSHILLKSYSILGQTCDRLLDSAIAYCTF